ncbi:cytochrome P450 [Xylariomycetidae sp. FL2044]|nr:cytochrome P450 [Xylariomycetidae sp. FL2044]
MEPIPGPPGWPIIGNFLDIDPRHIVKSWLVFAERFGPIFKLHLTGQERVYVGKYELVNEILSRKDFVKSIMGAVEVLGEVIPDGMFTAPTVHQPWGQARRILNPVFAPTSLKHMLPEMLDITSQLVLKWARHGPRYSIDVSTDFTRLALDIVALTTMDSRLNSFYREDSHPFVSEFGAMVAQTPWRAVSPAWYRWMQWRANRKFDEHNEYIRSFCADVLAQRRAREAKDTELESRKDVFTAMLHKRDPVTGKQLDDSCIIDNMITFLFAGHDTTAGLLSLMFYHFLKNPEIYAKVRQEVDSVLGSGAVTPEHLNKLPYIKSCVRETLRLEPPIPAFSVRHNKEEPLVIGGRYAIHRDHTIQILVPVLHRDPALYGDDADEFRPERMSEENFSKLPKHAFHPFGHGVRNCIGSEFAMQEAMVATAVLFQRFDFTLADPNYKLQLQPGFNRKTDNFFMHAELRKGNDVRSLHQSIIPSHVVTPEKQG